MTRLTQTSANNYSPNWSADGCRRILFESNRDGNWEVYVMDGDGSNPKNLSNSPTNDQGPVWSPASDQISVLLKSRRASDLG